MTAQELINAQRLRAQKAEEEAYYARLSADAIEELVKKLEEKKDEQKPTTE